MAVNVLLPLLIPLAEQINNGTGTLSFSTAVYDVSVKENEAPACLLTLRTESSGTDSEPVSYGIVEGALNGTFALHPKSGDLTLKSPLDYETKSQYELSVIATVGSERAFGRVRIHVQDVNDHRPAFERPSYETQVTEEDDRQLPKKILQVSAKDGDQTDLERLVYSLYGETVSVAPINGSNGWIGFSSTPDDANFAINPSNGEIFLLKALDRDAPLGRTQWTLTVGVTDGKNVARALLLVNVKDINDNAPFFPIPAVNATVKENGGEGDEVTQVEAVDLDDPKEGSNAILTFSLEKNVIDEGSGRPIFDIDSGTGRITTALCCLDREKTSSYSIQVVATDGGGLKGTGTVYVQVADENDNPPRFTESAWEFFVPESTEVNATLAVFTIEDSDITNNFSFNVMPGSGPGWDRFLVLSKTSRMGSLISLKPFDYEDPNQMEGFRFKVHLTDKGEDWDDPLHQASAWVIVHILDDNDNSPVFQNPRVNLTLPEDTAPGILLTHMFATDVDNGGISKISYTLAPSSDHSEIFTIEAGGQVRLRRPLNRETRHTHTLEIIAIDGGHPPRSATSSIFVSVTDVNDNPPFLRSPKEVILLENEAPRVLAELILDDEDDWTLGHGPPFHVSMDTRANAEIKESFAVSFNPNGDEGRGAGILHSLLPLDREKGKTRYIPIVVTDSEGLSSTVTLPVTIGDINDNPMMSGIKRVRVLRPKDVRYRIPLGRIFVDDSDDWDIGDKVWHWAKGHVHPMFTLDTHSGHLNAEKNVLDNEYHLHFRVSDKIHHQSNIPAEVYVLMKTLDVDVETFHLVIPLYIGSHSPEHLILPDKKKIPPLDALMQELRSVTEDKVEFLALGKESQGINPKTLKMNSHKEWLNSYSVVWMNAKSRPLLGQLILMKQEEIFKKTKVKINAVGIGICAHFKDLKYFVYHHKRKGYDEGDTQAYLKYSWVTDANTTALITPMLQVTKRCNCKSKPVQDSNSSVGHNQALQIKTGLNILRTCNPNPCLNGGHCLLSDQGPKCICPYGTEKMLCKQTSRQFWSDGWVQVAPLSSCANLHTSFEFRTKAQHGVLIFTESRSNEYFMNSLQASSELKKLFYLEIRNGLPHLFIKVGMTEVSLGLSNHNEPMSGNFSETFPWTVSDGSWHRLDLFWTKNSVHILVVDMCQKVPDQCHSSAYFPDESFGIFNSFPNSSYFLSWDSPLHIGGLPRGQNILEAERYLPYVAKVPFQGCIRNLRINHKVIDLGRDKIQNRTTPGCDDERFCDQNFLKCSPTTERCFLEKLYAHCPCSTSGEDEEACNGLLSPSTFGMKSIVNVSPTFTVPKLMTTVQLRLGGSGRGTHSGNFLCCGQRTAGVFYCSTCSTAHLCSVVVLNASSPSSKGFFFPLNFTLCLPQTTLNDGRWHSANFHRNENFAELWAEGGDWPFYNSTLLHPPVGSISKNVEVTGIPHSRSHSEQTLGEDRVKFIDDQNIRIRIAGPPDYHIPDAKKTYKHYFDGCLDAIYLWGRYLPLPLHRNDANWAGFSESESDVKKGCSNPPVCLNITCPKPLKCIDIWKRHKCSCGEGKLLSESGNICMDTDECLWKPCLRGGTCVNEEFGYSCLCPVGFSGKNCETLSIAKSSGSLSIGVVISIMTCCCFIILGLLAFILYLKNGKKRRKSPLQAMTEMGSYPQQTSSSFIVGMDHFQVAAAERSENTAQKQENRLLEVDVLRVNCELAPVKRTYFTDTKSDKCQQLFLQCTSICHEATNEVSSDESLNPCHNIIQSNEDVPQCRRKGDVG